MKTLRTTLVLVTALATTAAFASPPGKTPVPPRGSAAYKSAPATPAAPAGRTMIEKSGKRTFTVVCDGATAKCRAHCSQ